jgi:hypothetical protein
MGRAARLALTATTLLAVGVLAWVLLSGAPSSRIVTVPVEPGDSIWSIAVQAAPDRDPRDVVQEIRQLNGLAEGALPERAVVRVPASGGSELLRPAG